MTVSMTDRKVGGAFFSNQTVVISPRSVAEPVLAVHGPIGSEAKLAGEIEAAVDGGAALSRRGEDLVALEGELVGVDVAGGEAEAERPVFGDRGGGALDPGADRAQHEGGGADEGRKA
jgi:hypothetical protein